MEVRGGKHGGDGVRAAYKPTKVIVLPKITWNMDGGADMMIQVS